MLETKKSLNDIKKVIYFAIGIFVLVYVYLIWKGFLGRLLASE